MFVLTLLCGQFNPTSLANVTLVDPAIKVTAGDKMTFTLSAQGGVGAWTWLDHPAGTVGYFYDTTTNKPVNGFYLIPGQDRTGMLLRFSLLFLVAKVVFLSRIFSELRVVQGCPQCG